MINRIYRYREFLKTNVKKDIRGKYKGSFLGVLWSFINPLLMALIYAIVFPFILKNSQDNYVTFIVIGILPWTFFTTVIQQGTYCILFNAGIIKKVYFPREILPISVATSGLINFFIALPIILLFCIFSGLGLSFYALMFPLIALVQFILLLGIILITSSINVYIRDLEYIVQFFVNMLFYATPILYSSTLFPGKYRWFLNMNPMTTLINSYRDIFYYKRFPDFGMLGIVFLGSLTLLLIGIKIFKKLERRFAEEV